jgi:alanyl-tRNA synthetase
MSASTQYLSSHEIRQKFLDFYVQRGHQIVESASLVPEDPTVLLTIAGMLPFKPIFLGQQPAPQPRATSFQKCIRTNDIENVGRTARHQTFFEMLGNFSFGDYFKEQAIEWAWELSTKVFGLPEERVIPSVHYDDDEAFAIWRDRIGIPPHRIIRMGEDNFWTMGATGPCGTSSELFYDFHPELGDENIDLEDDTRFIEFYNLVFMQYNRDVDGNLTPLQNKNIDTGLGLERMAQILQNVPNNYETDAIFPIIKAAAELAEIDYNQADENTKVSLKVIGDHMRAIAHCIADGITASNVGRGYILRRLIRRVVRHCRLIGVYEKQGLKTLVTPKIAEVAIALGESVYPTLRVKEPVIVEELEREEFQFLKTLDRGEKLIEKILVKMQKTGEKTVSGEDAFTLYDTYGFPLELTQEIAAEHNLDVDADGFEIEMEKQRQRAKQARETIDLTVQGSLDKLAQQIQTTEFLGYSHLNSSAIAEVVLVGGKPVDAAEAGTEVQIILDRTPFYAESGGQIGDRGYLSGEDLLVRIHDVRKDSDFFVHMGKVERGTIKTGDRITAQIDTSCRRRAQANHTATHLLQAALKKLVDESISQAGSLVSFDRLRFDFNCPRALTAEDLSQVESQVNNWISEAHSADISVMSLNEAKAKGAIAMFGEKYSEQVRVLDFPGVSMELCGGTHVSNTAEIGAFKIISESGIAAGVRRIEAVAGPAILDYLNVRDTVVKELSDRFKAKPEELTQRISTLQTELKTTQKELESLKGELAVLKSDKLLDLAETVGDYQILVAEIPQVDPEALKTAAERLLHKLKSGAVVLASVPEADKVSLIAAFSPEVNQKGLQAGKFIGNIAKTCGGGGGGRPNLAQAGGKDASKLSKALESAKAELISGLG